MYFFSTNWKGFSHNSGHFIHLAGSQSIMIGASLRTFE
jgi:hypothetical protein